MQFYIVHFSFAFCGRLHTLSLFPAGNGDIFFVCYVHNNEHLGLGVCFFWRLSGRGCNFFLLHLKICHKVFAHSALCTSSNFSQQFKIYFHITSSSHSIQQIKQIVFLTQIKRRSVLLEVTYHVQTLLRPAGQIISCKDGCTCTNTCGMRSYFLAQLIFCFLGAWSLYCYLPNGFILIRVYRFFSFRAI